MKGWQEDYKKKLVSFEEAAKDVKSGDLLLTGIGAGSISAAYFEAVLDRWEELHDVTISDSIQLRPCRLYNAEFMKKLDGHIKYMPGFGIITIRDIHAQQVCDVFPTGTSDIGVRTCSRVSVYSMQCCPPNKHGYMNLGICNDNTLDNLRMGRQDGKLRSVVAEVNDQMPVVFGDNWVHVSEVDMIIENSSPILTFMRGEATEVEKTIGQYVLELLKDGDTIQMGIGGISEAVVAGLEGLHDLGVMTEIFPVGLAQLVKKGIVNNAKKPFHKGISIATFTFGDEEAVDFVSENPTCQIYPGSYCNNPGFLAQHPNLVSINTSLLADLSGQIASEGIGHRMISGTGGQCEFAIGAWFSPGGRGINVMRSVQRRADGKLISSIVPELPLGTPVSVPRLFANYVVTEYGIAYLRNKSRRERALELISIAHPDLRGELRQALKKNFYFEGAQVDF